MALILVATNVERRKMTRKLVLEHAEFKLAAAGIRVVAGKIAAADVERATKILTEDEMLKERVQAKYRITAKVVSLDPKKKMFWYIYTDNSHGLDDHINLSYSLSKDEEASHADNIFTGTIDQLVGYIKKEHPETKSIHLEASLPLAVSALKKAGFKAS